MVEEHEQRSELYRAIGLDGTGFYIFDGFRRMNAGRIVTIRDLVEVRRVRVGRKLQLEVVMMGKSTRYPAQSFDGVFTRVLINFGGERL